MTQVHEAVVPALLAALEGPEVDVQAAALLALGKIGREQMDSVRAEFESYLLPYLRSEARVVGEAAALALGLLGRGESVDELMGVMLDESGLGGGPDPVAAPWRRRACAAQALGLIGSRTDDNRLRQRIAAALIEVLNAEKFETRDLKLAALFALGATPLDWAGRGKLAPSVESGALVHWLTREGQLSFLLDYLDPDLARAAAHRRHWLIRSHVPAVLVRLLADSSESERAEPWRVLVADALLTLLMESPWTNNQIVQGSALALGKLGTAGSSGCDREIRRCLSWLFTNGDQQSRYFALIALGQIAARRGRGEAPWEGTAPVRKFLVHHMTKGKSAIQPWAALAVGVMGQALVDTGQPLDPKTGEQLRACAASECNPHHAGAYALAAALRGDEEALFGMHDWLDSPGDPQLAAIQGQVATAFGLLGLSAKAKCLRGALDAALKEQPSAAWALAEGLALVETRDRSTEWVERLARGRDRSALAALAEGIGSLADFRSIAPLVALLADPATAEVVRPYAAAALGIACGGRGPSWHAEIVANRNYRALPRGYFDREGQGILQIL